MGRTSKIFIFFLTGLIVAGGGAVFWWNAQFKQPGPLKTEITVIIERGAGANAIADFGDEIEYGSVQRVFGDAAKDLLMSSTKSAIGHLLGAAGAVEAIFSILAMRDGVAPRNWSTRRLAAPTFWPRSSATACRATPTTSPRRPRTETAPPGACRWR